MELCRGLNIGGYLSQCRHEIPHYESWITEEDIKKIADWGFDHVRLPVDYEVLQTADGTPVPRGYGYIERVAEWCKSSGLDMIIDLHKTFGYDFNDAGDAERNGLFASEALQTRFVELWRGIAEHFAHYEHIAFELLNEVVEDENAEPWNNLIARTVAAIREIAPKTPIIYGGICWNSSQTLRLLEKPADENIIFTFHFYEPMIFTHQKAGWVKNMDMSRIVAYPDDMAVYRRESFEMGGQGNTIYSAKADTVGIELIRELVKPAVEAARNAGVKVYCGEFGVIDEAPAEDTLRWCKDVDAVFRENGIGCALWTYKEMNFGLAGEHYDGIRSELIKLWNGAV